MEQREAHGSTDNSEFDQEGIEMFPMIIDGFTTNFTSSSTSISEAGRFIRRLLARVTPERWTFTTAVNMPGVQLFKFCL